MIEYDVTIPERPLGVRFAHADHGQTVVVHKVLPEKLGATLGLEPGDILLRVNDTNIMDLSSAEALDLFRKAPTPYRATFRRIEDDDTYLSDEDEDPQNEFVRDDAEYLLHTLSLEQYHRSIANVDLDEWSVEDVVAWIQWWSRNLGEPDRFVDYLEDFRRANVTGRQLRTVNEDKLREIGVIDDMDIRDLMMGVQEICGVVSKIPTREARTDTLNSVSENKAGDEDDPDWEAPFLPYLYDAPTVRLSGDTVVQVSSARVVAPYKKRPFALYEIDVSDGDNEWLLSKRYSEFWQLSQAMKALGIKTRANFPGRRLFKSADSAVIEQRKQALTAYLQELLKDHPAARESKEFNEFLSPSRTFVVDA